MKLMSQFQAEVPHPLGDQLPALLSPGRVTTPTIRVDFLVFISQSRLKGTTMQIQLNDVSGGEGALREIGEEQFVDDARTCDANRALLFARRMRCHDHATPYAIGTHRNLWAVVETANHLAFRTLLELIRWQV